MAESRVQCQTQAFASFPSKPTQTCFLSTIKLKRQMWYVVPKKSCLSFEIWVICGRASHMRGLSCQPWQPIFRTPPVKSDACKSSVLISLKVIWQAGTAASIASGVHSKIISHQHTHTYTKIFWGPYSQRLTKG